MYGKHLSHANVESRDLMGSLGRFGLLGHQRLDDPYLTTPVVLAIKLAPSETSGQPLLGAEGMMLYCKNVSSMSSSRSTTPRGSERAFAGG